MIRSAAGWVFLVATAVTVGAFSVRQPTVVVMALGAAILVVLFTKPTVAAVLAVALVPLPVSILPGLPIQVSATDILVLVAVGGWAVAGLVGQRELDGTRGPTNLMARARSVRTFALGLLAYAVPVVLSLVVHPSTSGVATALQRVLLVVGALLVGGGLVRCGRLRLALEAYLVVAMILAVAVVFTGGAGGALGVNKNPAGGFLAAGLLIAVLVRPTKRWVLYGPVLAAGLLATQSRGALLGLGVAIVVTLLVARLRDRGRLLLGVVASLPVMYLGYRSLSSSAQLRLQNFTADDNEFAITSREGFQADAFDAFRSSPWSGVGMGSYRGGPRAPGIVDPHNVLYLTLAEGGVPLLVGFLLLAATTLVVAFRGIVTTRLAVVALAVQASTLVHGQVDVYWVRGTPTPPYLLLGAAAAVVAYARAGDSRVDEWLVRPGNRAAQGDQEPGDRPEPLEVARA